MWLTAQMGVRGGGDIDGDIIIYSLELKSIAYSK